MRRLNVAEVRVADLPEPCRWCLFWETGGRPGTDLDEKTRDEAQTAKESCWQLTVLDWGTFAIGVWDDEELAGYALVAPSTYFQGTAKLGRTTGDALLLANLWTHPETDQESVASTLVEGALRFVVASGAHALEAFGAVTSLHDCVPRREILIECGFTFHRPGFPHDLYRLDVRQTARWRETVEEAIAAVRKTLRSRRLQRVPSMPSTMTQKPTQG